MSLFEWFLAWSFTGLVANGLALMLYKFRSETAKYYEPNWSAIFATAVVFGPLLILFHIIGALYPSD